MAKELDLNVNKYVEDLKAKLSAVESDIASLLEKREAQEIQLSHLEEQKQGMMLNNETLTNALQAAKDKQKQLEETNKKLDRELKARNNDHIRMISEGNEQIQAAKKAIEEGTKECKELEKQIEEVLHSNDDLLNKKERLMFSCELKQQELAARTKDWEKMEAADLKRRETLAKALKELKF